MEVERPIRRIRRKRLEQLLSEFGGPKKLAEVTGTTDTHLIACQKGRRGIGDDLAHSLEVGTKKHFGWMDEDPACAVGQGWVFGSRVDPERLKNLDADWIAELAGAINDTLRRAEAASRKRDGTTGQ